MKKQIVITVCSAVVLSAATGPWTTQTLPNTTAAFNTWSLGHSNGKFIYAENGTLWSQDSFGSTAYTQYANSPVSGAGPSFISAGSGTAVLGKGGWGASSLVTFNPGTTATTFTDTGVTLQNYAGIMRGTTGAFIIGGNGPLDSDGFTSRNNLKYVSFDGTTSVDVIGDISKYSCGFAMDASGGLYVGDNDDGNIYYFSQTQLDAAIAGSTLAMADGTFVVDFGTGGDMGTLAVDANGVLWGAGWAHNGIISYDTNTSAFNTWKPGFDSSHYLVDTFSFGSSNYVGFASADGSAAGSNVVYGFADAAAVPEPGTVTLMVLGFSGLVWFRTRRRHFLRG